MLEGIKIQVITLWCEGERCTIKYTPVANSSFPNMYNQISFLLNRQWGERGGTAGGVEEGGTTETKREEGITAERKRVAWQRGRGKRLQPPSVLEESKPSLQLEVGWMIAEVLEVEKGWVGGVEEGGTTEEEGRGRHGGRGKRALW
ncbi:unnamed protein product [Victoria cruziana]